MKLRLLIDVEVEDAMREKLAEYLQSQPSASLTIYDPEDKTKTVPLHGRFMGAQVTY
jgi:hypothetical protein